jgi:hypothetical protein
MEVMSVTGAVLLIIAVLAALFVYHYASGKGWIAGGNL